MLKGRKIAWADLTAIPPEKGNENSVLAEL